MTASAAARQGETFRPVASRGGGCVAHRQRATCLRGLIVVVLVGATGWALVPEAATATTSAGLAARAHAVAAALAADNAEAAALGNRYLAERSSYDTATLQASKLTRDIARVNSAVTGDRRRVLDAAVSAYVSSGSANALTLFLDGNAATVATGETYLRVASDVLGEAVVRLHDEEHALATSRNARRIAAATAADALRSTARDRAQVVGTAASEEKLLGSLRGQLATLVREQELARERAAALAQAAQARAAAVAAAARAAAAAKASAAAPSAGATPTATTAPPSGPPAAPASSPIPPGTLSQDFATIRNCESSDDYSLDTGNGYYGAYQFSLGTWQGLGGSGLPSSAPPAVQDAKAYELYLGSGWSAWPECAALAGL